MRYSINFDKTVNQLVPHYLGGRKLILFLQSLMKPLQAINDAFIDYAKETRIESAMTSQKIMFEWFLNRKFQQFFLDGGLITITNGERIGSPIYYENADISKSDNMLLYEESENKGTDNTALYHSNEKTDQNSFSFVVSSPSINTNLISQEQYEAMLSYWVDRYRLSGKTYKIKFNS